MTQATKIKAVSRQNLPYMTVEEFLAFLGYDKPAGEWRKVSNDGVAPLGTDLLVAFCKGGKLGADLGESVMEPANELAALKIWDVKALLRDYHPDGPNMSHCSYTSAYKALVNSQVPVLLTIPMLQSWGTTDADVLTPAAINAGITVDLIIQGLEATSPDPAGQVLMVWTDEHAGQKNGDSEFHPKLKVPQWDLVHLKGTELHPWWEEYGGFYASTGPQLGDNGLHKVLQTWRGLARRGVTQVTKLVNTGLVTEYCVVTTSNQAQSLGYDVVNAVDAIAPFDPAGEEATFAQMIAIGQRFVTNEVIAEAASIIASI